jgi:hypothetical protein
MMLKEPSGSRNKVGLKGETIGSKAISADRGADKKLVCSVTPQWVSQCGTISLRHS